MEIDEIDRRTFPISRRGYDRADVDAFLAKIAAEYRQTTAEYSHALETAKDAVRSAATEAASLSSSHTFENVGSHVASILATASQAAENLRTEAEQDAREILRAAEETAAELRKDAEAYNIQADGMRSKVEQEARALRDAARSDVERIIAEARDQASRIEQEAEGEASRLERVARANVETKVSEGRREYEHLRALQQQVIDRMASIEFLIQEARDGISANAVAANSRNDPAEESLEEVAASPKRTRARRTD